MASYRGPDIRQKEYLLLAEQRLARSIRVARWRQERADELDGYRKVDDAKWGVQATCARRLAIQASDRVSDEQRKVDWRRARWAQELAVWKRVCEQDIRLTGRVRDYSGGDLEHQKYLNSLLAERT